MRSDHLTDRDIILLVDGELRSGTREAKDHLEACWSCRSRMMGIQETIADFARTYHESMDAQLTPAAGPRGGCSRRNWRPTLRTARHLKPPAGGAGCLQISARLLRLRSRLR